MEHNIKELYEKGRSLYEKGRYLEAELLLKDVISEYPYYADVLNMLGFMAHMAGRLNEAADYLKRAVAINPQYTEAALNLTITYNSLGQFDKATEVFSQSAQIAHPSPTSIDPYATRKLANEHYKLGKLYIQFSLYEDAIEQYEKALSLYSELPDAHTSLGVALRDKGRFDEAVEHFKKAKEITLLYGPAWVQLGLTYYMQDKKDLALDEWESALKHLPELKEARAYIELINKGG